MHLGSFINHVDSEGGRGVPEKTMSVHKGGGGVRGWSTWTKIFIYMYYLLHLMLYCCVNLVFPFEQLHYEFLL